ncbi:hypothetical protein D3C74_412570 [compost metagenome]
MRNGTDTWTETQKRSNCPWMKRIRRTENASVPKRGFMRHSTTSDPKNRTRNATTPTIPADVRTSSSAFGGWKVYSVRFATHQRSPTPTQGLRSHTSIACSYQVSRW